MGEHLDSEQERHSQQTDGTQNHSEGTGDGLGLSPSEKQKQRNNSKFAQNAVNAKLAVRCESFTAPRDSGQICPEDLAHRLMTHEKTNGLILCCPTIWKDNLYHGRKGKNVGHGLQERVRMALSFPSLGEGCRYRLQLSLTILSFVTVRWPCSVASLSTPCSFISS